MKKAILIILATILCSCLQTAAQGKYRYIEARAYHAGLVTSDNYRLWVDFGQALVHNMLNRRYTEVCFDNGTPLEFCSQVDILNWLSDRGWELVTSSTAVSGGENESSVSTVRTWFLRYNIEGLSGEEQAHIYDCFITKKSKYNN